MSIVAEVPPLVTFSCCESKKVPVTLLRYNVCSIWINCSNCTSSTRNTTCYCITYRECSRSINVKFIPLYNSDCKCCCWWVSKSNRISCICIPTTCITDGSSETRNCECCSCRLTIASSKCYVCITACCISRSRCRNSAIN